MLVLGRKVGETLVINDQITVVVHKIKGNRVSLAIEAPEGVTVLRGELQAIRSGFTGPAEAQPPRPTACAESQLRKPR